MTLLRLVAAAALFVAPAAAHAADASPTSQSGDSGASQPNQPSATPRRPERRPQGSPLRPRIVEAPGAALMLIPATWFEPIPR